MANIKAFRGIRYNPEKIEDQSTVLSQPYDRVRYGLQDQYYDLSDYSIVRIIKGKSFDTDGDGDNVYTRARNFLDQWLEENVLLREDRPALYVFHQQFPLSNGEVVTRKSFICAFELAGFDVGVVLPHERTLSGPKVDRLELTRATETYFGNIFMLYPDPENRIDALLAPAIDRQPDIDVRELHEKDVRQLVWVVTDPEVIEAMAAEMAPKRNLIIADGHHRYETALNYQAEQQARYPAAPAEAGFNYRLVTMVSMSNPGLTILPTHRLIFNYAKLSSQELLAKVSQYFDVETMADRPALETKMADYLNETGRIGLVSKEGYHFLTLKEPAIMDELTPDRIQAWKELDVSILHELLLEHIMGLTKESIEHKENIDYLREPDMGYEQVASGKAQFLFYLNPTKMVQVTDCTKAGEKMPQKSTDFYPKVITGLTMLAVGPKERI